MVRTAVDRASCPPRTLFEQVGDMMILTAKTIVSAIRPPYPYGGEFIGQFLFALQLCWFPMMISTRRLRLRRPGPAGGQLPLPVRRARPPRRLLRPRLDPRVRPIRHRGRRRRRRRHRDHRRPRRPQDPRGARRAPGARRRPDQEPRRAPLPRPDADHRADGHLRADLRDLGGIGAELLYNQPLGGFFATLFNNASVTDLWGSVLKTTLFGAIIADRLLLQGDDRLRRRRGGRSSRQRGGGDRLHGGLRLQLRLHADPARPTHPDLQVIR